MRAMSLNEKINAMALSARAFGMNRPNPKNFPQNRMGVMRIFGARDTFEIVNSVIAFVSVAMIYFVSLWNISIDRHPDKAMQKHIVSFLSVWPGGHVQIARAMFSANGLLSIANNRINNPGVVVYLYSPLIYQAHKVSVTVRHVFTLKRRLPNIIRGLLFRQSGMRASMS